METKKLTALIIVLVFLACVFETLGQTRSKRKQEKVKKVEETKPTAEPEVIVLEKFNKRNQKPEEERIEKPVETKSKQLYLYQFEADQFRIKRIKIEHDEKGIGSIGFVKSDSEEEIQESLKLSSSTLEKIRKLFDLLAFLDSNEDYQSKERNYKHLGTITIGLRANGKERFVSFNWTEQKNAKALAEEYRKISNQQIWIFEMNLSRENQPLEAPDLLKRLDSYISRDEISDPDQLLKYLEDLANDERIPLIARNHAKRLIEMIKKKRA